MKGDYMSENGNNVDRFNEVYNKYWSMIYNYCLENLYKDVDSANDACTNVFMVFNRKQDKVSDESVRLWLYSTAKNVIKSVKRRYARKFKNIKIQNIDDCEISVELFDDITMSPEYIKKVKIEIMERLDENDKILFKYKYIDEKSLNEIAEILNIPYSTLYYNMTEVTRLSKKILKEITDKLPY